MNYKQYIFCIETKSKANTDWLYIRKVIDYINNGKQVFDKYVPLYMEGKGNYNSKSFISKLKTKINMYNGKSIVIYCVDLDNYHKKFEDKVYFENVKKYCDENKYELVYFSRYVEEVFWSKRVKQENKIKYAAKFSKDIEISNDLINRLSKETKDIMTSNLYVVLRKFINE